MRYFLICAFFLFSNTVNAAVNYYWNARNSTVVYSTADAACLSQQAKANFEFARTVTYVGYVRVHSATTEYYCKWSFVSGGVTYVQTNYQMTAFLRGDTCPAGTVVDMTTGTCPAPPPVCEVGALFPAKGADGTVITSNGVNYVSGSSSPTVCYQQCVYQPPDGSNVLSAGNRPISCYGTPGGVGWCNYVLKSTGANCGADSYAFAKSGPQLNPTDTANVPESDPINPLCPKGWSVSAGTCYKNPSDPLNPPPETGTASNETGGTGTSGGGSGSTEQSAGATDDLADSVAGTSGDTASAPCVPNADGSGCGGTTVRGESCDVVLACTGDAIQCASLRYQKAQRCASIYDVPAQNFVKTQISKDEYQLTQNEVDGSDLFADGTGAARWLPSACPSPKPINLHGISTTLSMQPACDFASALGPLFVALASIFFAVYVGRSFGGS